MNVLVCVWSLIKSNNQVRLQQEWHPEIRTPHAPMIWAVLSVNYSDWLLEIQIERLFT